MPPGSPIRGPPEPPGPVRPLNKAHSHGFSPPTLRSAHTQTHTTQMAYPSAALDSPRPKGY